MFPVLALTAFALLVARVMRAPAGTWRWIVAAAAAALAGSQLLPAGNPWRADVAGSARLLFWIGLALVPVAAYAVVLRGLRRRTGADAALAGAPPPAGLVCFPEDAALAAETAAALAAEADAALGGERLSLGWRGADGALEGHLRLRLGRELAEVELIRVAPGARGRGLGAAMLGAAEAEARTWGARRVGALVADWQSPGFFARAGYVEAAAHTLGDGRRRVWMEKSL